MIAHLQVWCTSCNPILELIKTYQVAKDFLEEQGAGQGGARGGARWGKGWGRGMHL